MAKRIELDYTHKLCAEVWVEVTARNNKIGHCLNIDGKSFYVSTDELKDFGNFLLDTASKIDSDPDFKPQS